MREKGRPFIEGGGEGLPSEETVCQERWAIHQKGEHLSRGGGGVRRGRRTFVRREGPFIEVEECSSKEGASIWGGERSSRECSLGENVRQERGCSSRENVCQERSSSPREENIRCERGQSSREGGGHSLREENIHKPRGPFVERGNARQEKGPFVEAGDRSSREGTIR